MDGYLVRCVDKNTKKQKYIIRDDGGGTQSNKFL